MLEIMVAMALETGVATTVEGVDGGATTVAAKTSGAILFCFVLLD